jgi:hypothetical protein
MTLVAAFKDAGIPVLIGDMALTKGEIRSLRKKVYIISPNLAVGWAGHSIVAKIVITALRNNFANKTVTKLDLEFFFKGYQSEDFGSLHTNFIGWLIDDEPHCFLWNCLYPSEVFYNSYFVEGTGEEYFESLKKQSWIRGGSLLSNQDQAVLSVITHVAQARFEESLYRETWNLSFGASYDILVFMDGRFRNVRSIAYIGWDYYWDSQLGTGRLEQAPFIIKHTCMGEHSIIQESMQGKHYTGKTTNYLSRPVYDDMPEADLSDFAFTLDSDYYANYFLFRENGNTLFKILLTLQRTKDKGPLIIKQQGGAYFLHYNTEELDRIYRTYQKKYQVEPNT